MTSTLEPMTAGEVYFLRLEPKRRTRWGRVVAGALDLWCATVGGQFELSGAGDVVVRRVADGVAELRVAAGDVESAAVLLDAMRDQLETMTPEEFREAWSID